MKIVIFGATGKTGRELVLQALKNKHAVTAFVRDAESLKITDDNLRVVVGDVIDYPAVESAIKGQDAVLCALGAASPFKHDKTLIQGVGNIVKAMEANGVRRLVYLSFLGVPGGQHQWSWLGRYILNPLLLRIIAADHKKKEDIIRAHVNIDWTLVRPPHLSMGPFTGTYRSGEDVRAQSADPAISRADLADYMLKVAADDSQIRKAPTVMY